MDQTESDPLDTPILSCRESMPAFEKPNHIASTIIALIVSGLFIGLLHHAGISTDLIALLTSMLKVLAIAPAIVAIIAIHELGHLVMGLFVGMRFSSITVWPIRAAIEGGRLRVRLQIVPTQNATYMIAKDFDDYRYRTALFAAAGAFANLACFAVAFLFVLGRPDAGNVTSFFTFFLIWLAYLSLLVGITNVLIFRKRSLPSDGAVLYDAVRNAPEFRRSIAIQRLGIAMREGVRPRELDRELVAEAIALRDGSRVEMSANIIAYSAFASDNSRASVMALERALAATRYAVPADRQALAVEAAVYAASQRKDVSLARHWLQGINLEKASPILRLRVEASLAYAEGHRDLAIAKVEELIADPSLTRLPTRAVVEAECRSWIDRMRDEP